MSVTSRLLVILASPLLGLLAQPTLAMAGPPEGESAEGPAIGDPAEEPAAEEPAAEEPAAEAPVEEEPASVSLGGSASTDDGVSGEAEASEPKEKKEKGQRWIDRYAPENGMIELGVWGGVMFPSPNIELFKADQSLTNQGRKQYGLLAPDVGVRIGYYPLKFFGIEAEGGVMPASLRDGSGNPVIWAGRGHLVGQLGLWRLTPFIVAGAGAMGVASPRSAVGSEADIAIHFGAGLKFYVNYWLMLRLDVRDNLTNRFGVGEGVTHTPEVLLGISVTLMRKKDKPPPRDRDGDGIPDRDDKCVNVPGDPPTGCPPDRDQDTIPDPVDACPDDPETRNGFEDDEGCPDEVPDEFADLAGILKGIHFDSDKDVVKSESKPILDKAVEVLKKFPSVRIEVSGHTDSRGEYEHNMDLSRRRADAVERYLVEAGIDSARIETRGAGPNEPIASNDTSTGRAENRRIEVKIVTH